MRITEVEQAAPIDLTKLVALSQFLIGRADDTGAAKRISLNSFIQQAHNLGIGITAESLQNLATSGPLRSVIANVTPTEVIFRGADDITGDVTGEMNADQSQNIVAGMAKRALK